MGVIRALEPLDADIFSQALVRACHPVIQAYFRAFWTSRPEGV